MMREETRKNAVQLKEITNINAPKDVTGTKKGREVASKIYTHTQKKIALWKKCILTLYTKKRDFINSHFPVMCKISCLKGVLYNISNLLSTLLSSILPY